MKKFRLSEFLWAYLFILCQLVYLLIEPLIFATVGMIFQVNWQYYLVTIGGYYAFSAVWEFVVFLMSDKDSKKFHAPVVRRFKKVLARFSQNEKNVEHPPKEGN